MDLNTIRLLAGQDISIDFKEGILILDYGKNSFKFLIDPEKRNCYLKIMAVIDDDPEVKVVLTLADPDSLGEENFNQYLRKICGSDVELNDLGNSWAFKKNIDRSRQIYFHHYTIEQRLSSKKIIIDGLRGSVVTPFFGETLSADLRYATSDMRFSLVHKKYGLYPNGGLAFFLPRYVGQGKASELMLTSDSIDAEQALELGLITAILPSDDFVLECIKQAKKISSMNRSTIESTKLLSTLYKKELDSYFEAEKSLVAYFF